MTADPLVIETRTERGCTIVSLAGELDLDTGPALAEALNACADGLPVIVETSALDFFGSSGLHVLMGRRAVQPAALVCEPDSTIARVLQIVRADQHFPVFESLAAALEALGEEHRTEPSPEPLAGDTQRLRRRFSLRWS